MESVAPRRIFEYKMSVHMNLVVQSYLWTVLKVELIYSVSKFLGVHHYKIYVSW